MTPSVLISAKPKITNSSTDTVDEPTMDVAATTSGYDPVDDVGAVDSSFHAALAPFTGGLSPAALALAFADWQLHLLASPGKQAALAGQLLQRPLGDAPGSYVLEK